MAEDLDFAMNFDDSQQSDADKKLLVLFYRGTVKNEVESTNQGRPIFNGIDLVKIITPGSRDTFVGDATPDYQQRFSVQWARYKAGQDQNKGNGTPLNMLPWFSIEQIAEYNAVSVHTIEQLVSIPDSLAQKFMGFHQIKQRAQNYLDAAAEAAPTLRLQAEIEKKDSQLADQAKTIAALDERVKKMEKSSAVAKA